MAGLDTLPEKGWGKGDNPVVRPVLLARGTLESIDLAKTRRLAEVLGFDCAAPEPGGLVLRHRSDRAGATYWVLEVREVAEVRSPQHLTNHWGIWVPTRKDVDEAYAMLSANAELLGLIRVQPPRPTHEGARDYSFYFEDESRNWWEIGEHPDEQEFMDLFGHGDWDSRKGDPA